MATYIGNLSHVLDFDQFLTDLRPGANVKEPGQCRTEAFAHRPDTKRKPDGEWDTTDYTPLLLNEVADAIAYTIKQEPWANITMLRIEPLSKHFGK